MIKHISIILLATILLQSCVVYQKNSVPLSEACDEGKVKVISKTGEELKFKNIFQKDSNYYGLNQKKLKNNYGVYEWTDITIPLYADGVEAIYLKNKAKSIIGTISIVIAVPGAYILVMFLRDFVFI